MGKRDGSPKTELTAIKYHIKEQYKAKLSFISIVSSCK